MLNILFVTDYVCPYCLLAKEALKLALKESGMEAQIEYHPLELSRRPPKPAPAQPPTDEERAARMAELKKAAQALNLDMKMPPSIPRPTTTKAFEGWHYACEQDLGDEWSDLMYRAFFIEEKDISDYAVLREMAERIGLDADGLIQALTDNRYADRQTEAHRHSMEDLKAFFVPTMIVNGVQAKPEAYTIADMMDILLGHMGDGEALHCDEDGCK